VCQTLSCGRCGYFFVLFFFGLLFCIGTPQQQIQTLRQHQQETVAEAAKLRQELGDAIRSASETEEMKAMADQAATAKVSMRDMHAGVRMELLVHAC